MIRWGRWFVESLNVIATYLLSNAAIHGEGALQISEKGYYFEAENSFSNETENDSEYENSRIYSYETDSAGNRLTYEEIEEISSQNMVSAFIVFVCAELLIVLVILFKRLRRKWWYYLLYIPVLLLLVFAISRFREVEIYQENLLSTYFSFICVEFLLYMIMIFRKYRKEPLNYVTIMSLLIFTFIIFCFN